MIDYQFIFTHISSTLRDQSWLDSESFDRVLEQYQFQGLTHLTDAEIYRHLILIIFYAGFKASTVEQKEHIILSYFPDPTTVLPYDEGEIGEMMEDEKMIKHEKKIQACIQNSKVFQTIVDSYGSFKHYLFQFRANDSFENLLLLKEDLMAKFDRFSDITTYHFLTELGFNVVKPDRAVQRIYKRLGLIEHKKQLLKTIIHGRKFQQATGFPIRYIDVMTAKYGQLGRSEKFGLANGICLESHPRCHLCKLQEVCIYEDKPISKQNQND